MNWNLLIEQLGWTLVHSTWQIAIIAVVSSMILRATRSAAANLRYMFAVTALAFSIILPVATFLQVSETIGSPGGHGQFENADTRAISGDEVGAVTTYPNAGVVSAADTNENDSVISNTLSQIKQFFSQQFPSSFPFLVGLWLAGVGLYSARFAGGVYRLRQYRNIGVEPISDEWKRRFASLCERLKLKQTVELISSNIAATPIAIVILKPMIIVPASVFLQMDARQLESIIAHELIHIRRLYPAVNILQSVAEVLFFYHPGIWWLSAAIRREREFATDAAVVEMCSGDRVVYASALANLEEIRLTANIDAPSLATAANGGNLMQRIEKILNKKTEISRASSAWSAGMALALISALLLGVFWFTNPVGVNGQKRSDGRKVAIGFVSIPPLDRSSDPPKDSDATARLLIAKLQQHKIPAIGFLTGSSISDGEKFYPVRANIARLWRDAGFEIGIGGFKHLPFSEQPLAAYIDNVEKNERVAKQLLGEKNLPLRYFSYPYLDTRKNDEHIKFEDWLRVQGLTSVKYTIDNNEWMYSYAYDVARMDNDVNTMKEVREAFLNYMTKMFDHYEAYSDETFGRDIPQTMVLTPSRLITDSADDLFGMIRKRGYSFVSMDTALADDAFKTPETYEGDNGISWFDRWTLTAGKRLKDEPEIDPMVQKIWDTKKLVPKAETKGTIK